jgi:D-serine deaminase-like pyridoxal phosphate-dependent protein
MARHGCDDLLISFPLVGRRKEERLVELAATVRMAVAADSAVVARSLSAALAAGACSVRFLVDCDTGFRRTGVQTPSDAAELAELVDGLPGLELGGLMTHPSGPGSGEWFREARRLIERRGLEVACVSVGGTPLARSTHLLGGITELRVGTYAYNDARCLANGTATLADCALRVRATVVSTPTRERAILDAGSKTLTSDPLADGGGSFGRIVEYPEATIYALSEEHAHVDVAASVRGPEIGEVVTLVPNHACGTVNMHDEVALHHGGADVEIASVAARGLVR